MKGIATQLVPFSPEHKYSFHSNEHAFYHFLIHEIYCYFEYFTHVAYAIVAAESNNTIAVTIN